MLVSNVPCGYYIRRIDRLKRTVEMKDYLLEQQESKLRKEIREELERELKDMEYKVHMAQTREQCHVGYLSLNLFFYFTALYKLV